MSQPTLYPVPAFDKVDGHIFTFSYQGAQAYSNKLTIRNNDTNEIVYEKVQSTFQLKHDLSPEDAEPLVYGTCYNATVQVFDSAGTGTSESAAVLFYVFSNPVWRFNSVTDGMRVEASSLDGSVTYIQSESEPLNSHQFYLYDAAKVLVASSSTRYTQPDEQNVIPYSYTGLGDNTTYFVRAVGKTLNGMSVDTGYIAIDVQYITPSAFYLLELENQPETASIRIESNIIIIEGHADPSPPIFIDGEMIDLSADGATVTFDEGFDATNFGTVDLVFKAPDSPAMLMTMYGNNTNIWIRYKKTRDDSDEPGLWYCELICTPDGYSADTPYIANPYAYIGESNRLSVAAGDMLHLWIRRYKDTYQLVLFKV